MLKPILSLAVGLAAITSLAACNVNQIASAVQTVAGKLSGTIYAPGTQVAIVAQGAGNIVASGGGNATGDNSAGGYDLLSVRSDEVGVPNAVVKVMGGSTSATAQTDSAGKFSVSVPAGTTYHVTATFAGKDGSNITENGFAQVDLTFPLELGVAHNMVASKLLSTGVTNPDWAAFKAAVMQMQSDLQSVATTPTPTDQASAAAAFDANASAGLKTAVAAIKNAK